MRRAWTLIAALLIGCSSGSRGVAPGTVILVPGVGGDGLAYRNVVPALRACGDDRTVESFRWGAPGPAFFLNFSNAGIHGRAERALADRLATIRHERPGERLDLVAHSAGGGVVLGALARLPEGVRVDRVVLIHPSVSPTYPLDASLARADRVELFCSDRDTTFLSWRTSTFGTYDNVKSRAAGNAGFASEHPQLTTHRYDASADAKLGHDGGHFGALARDFLASRVAPLIAVPSAAGRGDVASMDRAAASVVREGARGTHPTSFAPPR
jgi:pimeloyl-ACP methyl ester carboxylesterase